MNEFDQLIRAFKAAAAVTDIGVTLVDDGFDATTMRVYSAWTKCVNTWAIPKAPQPDNGRPTAAAWEWLCSGWSCNMERLARGAGVEPDVARERLEILQHARLIFPDGSSSTFIEAALRAVVAERLSSSKKRKGKTAKERDEDAN